MLDEATAKTCVARVFNLSKFSANFTEVTLNKNGMVDNFVWILLTEFPLWVTLLLYRWAYIELRTVE